MHSTIATKFCNHLVMMSYSVLKCALHLDYQGDGNVLSTRDQLCQVTSLKVEQNNRNVVASSYT